MKPITEPDVTRTDRTYWESVLTSHGLDAEAGRPPQFWADRGEPSEKKLRRVLFVGTINNLAGVEQKKYRRSKGMRREMGHGPDSFEPNDPTKI